MPTDPPELHCRHLLVCRSGWLNEDDPDHGGDLTRLVVTLRPTDGLPAQVRQLFVYVQLVGDPGTYDLSVRLVRIAPEADNGPIEWGPYLLERTPFYPVDCYLIPLTEVPFDTAGVYEFQLLADGSDEPLNREVVWFIADTLEMP